MVELPKDPVVLVLLVATDGATWLPDVLRGLRAQRGSRLGVVAVDNASTDGSGDLLESALGAQNVISLDRRVGYGRALAAALRAAADSALEAHAFLLVHDDAELAPGAVDAMVDAMQRHDAGIVGAKLVDWADPGLLQDIGQAADRYGRLVPRVERGELDQGQHDGVHDVLWVTSAAMLIAREVVETVGLFDPRFVALRDDLDLCWRARLAGFRVVLTTDAVARHVSAIARGTRAGIVPRRMRYFADRNMLATLIKNYSAPRLALTLPVAVVTSLLNAVLFFFTGRRRAALQTLEALQWNVTHLPSTLRWRLRAQRPRREPDRVVTRLMHGGSSRLREHLERAVELVVGEVDEGDEETAGPRPGIFEQLRRHPAAATVFFAAVIGAIGARGAFFSGPMAGADMPPFPSDAGAFFDAFFSGWRGAGAGGAGPATPALLVLGVLSFLCLGSTWLAQRLLVLGLPLVGALLALRLTRVAGLTPGGRRLVAIASLASPLVLGAFGAGRLSDLVLATAAPGLLLSVLRIARVAPFGWRAAGAGVLALAATASFSPWALPAFLGACLVAAVVARSRRAARDGAIVTAGAVLLLFPWSVELFRRGSPFGAGGPSARAGMREILGLSVGDVRPIPEAVWYGFALAALLGFMLAPAARRRLAAHLGAIAAVSVAASWAVARGVPWIAPRPALPLAIGAVAVIVLGALAFEAAGPALTARQFGLRHVLAGVVGLLVVAQIGASALWIAAGDRAGIARADVLAPSFFAAEARTSGDFRVVWLSGSAERPVGSLAPAAGLTMQDYLPRPAGAGADAFRRAMGAIAAGTTTVGGRLLATLGVRYVIVRPDTHPSLVAAVGAQTDLRFSQRFRAAMIFQNEAARPIAATAAGVTAAAVSPPSLATVPGARTLRRTGRTSFVGVVPRGGDSMVLLAEDHSSRWRAAVDGRPIEPLRAFGWSTAFPVSAGRRLEVTWRGNGRHRTALVIELLLLLAFSAEWSRRAARERGER